MSFAAFSATRITGPFRFAFGVVGKIEASTTRSPGTLRTLDKNCNHVSL